MVGKPQKLGKDKATIKSQAMLISSYDHYFAESAINRALLAFRVWYIINPRRRRVTVLRLSVCLSVCLSVSTSLAHLAAKSLKFGYREASN